MKTAIIFGVTGQDGSYLSEFLLIKGYKVIGVTRRCSVDTSERIRHLQPDSNFEVVEGDLTDLKSVSDIVAEYQPDEVYNLAAQSHVGTSFKQPHLTWRVNAEGAFNVLEAVKQHCRRARVYQASTSEMFGSNMKSRIEHDKESSAEAGSSQAKTVFYQDETTEFAPNSPYAIAKLAAHNAVRMYREAYDIFACAGILFNHESPRRGENFVTRKVTMWVTSFKRWSNPIHQLGQFKDQDYENRIYNSLCDGEGFPKLRLGNLDARRDWGHAKDYVRGMWMMLQQDKPEDYVLATGETYSIRDLLDASFGCIGVDDWKDCVVVDPKFYRPFDVEYLLGSPAKAKRELGWVPEYNFQRLIAEMVNEDYEAILRREGYARKE